jgi:hypothetical protein
MINSMEKALILSYAYHDVDILELQVSAWNGCFGGATRLYVGREELGNIVEMMKGFPLDPRDEREVILGAFGAQFAGGAARLRFYCKDSAGHAVIEVHLEGDCFGRAVTESVRMNASIEPASIDSFLPELNLIGKQLSGSAALHFEN